MSGVQVENFEGKFGEINHCTSPYYITKIKIEGKFPDNFFIRRKSRKMLIRTLCKKFLCYFNFNLYKYVTFCIKCITSFNKYEMTHSNVSLHCIHERIIQAHHEPILVLLHF